MKAPSRAQKEWMGTVASLGCRVCGMPCQVHHCAGRSAKHNKVDIGHEFIVGLCDTHHRALHAGETFGHPRRLDFEKSEFYQITNQVEMPFGPEVYNAIMDYHR